MASTMMAMCLSFSPPHWASHPGATCEDKCATAGHCCVGATSGYSLPSCAQGCTVGKQAKTVAACNAACAAADGKCKWAFNSTLFQNCGSCPSTCCNAPVKGECQQGCAFAFD